MAGDLTKELETLRDRMDDLISDIEELEEENKRLEKENNELEGAIEDADDLPSWDDLENLALVIRHLLAATRVYDLADLKAAAINAGLDI